MVDPGRSQLAAGRSNSRTLPLHHTVLQLLQQVLMKRRDGWKDLKMHAHMQGHCYLLTSHTHTHQHKTHRTSCPVFLFSLVSLIVAMGSTITTITSTSRYFEGRKWQKKISNTWGRCSEETSKYVIFGVIQKFTIYSSFKTSRDLREHAHAVRQLG